MTTLEQVLSAIQPITNPHPRKQGTPVMLECFATWCPPCRAAIPHLAQMAEKYPNVYIVSVSREELEKVQTFAQRMPPMQKYNVAVETSGVLQDFMDQNGVEGIPHAFIFDAQGTIAFSGHPMDKECETTLEALNAK